MMKNVYWLLFTVAAALLVQCGDDSSYTETPKNLEDVLPMVVEPTEEEIGRGEVAEGSWLVGVRDVRADQPRQFSDYLSEARGYHPLLAERFLSNPEVRDLHYITSIDFARTQDFQWNGGQQSFFGWQPQSEKINLAEIEFFDGKKGFEMLKEWEAQGLIAYAEPNYISHLFQDNKTFEQYSADYATLVGGGGTPWLSQIDLLGAFNQLKSKKIDYDNPPLVAVMDSGVDYQHPALGQNIWQNPVPGQAGCLDDHYGCNATQSDKGILGNGDVFPQGVSGPNQPCLSEGTPCAHGTHVAGIIAAKPSATYGGVCPICKIVSIKVLGKDKHGKGSDTGILDSSILAGLTYISRFKSEGSQAIRLVNASFGKVQRSRSVEVMIRLLKSLGDGILVVGAAGNEDTMIRNYPAAYQDVVAVTNVLSNSGVKHQSSNFGIWTDIAAPGSGNCGGGAGGILSSVPGGSQACQIGTSMAAPIVTGVAALLLISEPEISFSALRDRLLTTSDPSLYSAAGNNPYYPKIEAEQFPIPLLGQGVVNANNALGNVVPDNKPSKRPLDRVNDGCGTITTAGNRAVNPWWLFVMPVLVVCGLSLRRRKEA
jgi:hypothetical protein